MKKSSCIFWCFATAFISIWACSKVGKHGTFAHAEDVVSAPSKSFIVVGKAPHRLITFTGTWRIKGDTVAYPKSLDKYECFEDRSECYHSTAIVTDNTLLLDTDIFEISSWEKDKFFVVDSGDCRTNTMVVDLLSEEVFSITKNAEQYNYEHCTKFVPYLSEPRKSILADPAKQNTKSYTE